jgi:hypothetical protein
MAISAFYARGVYFRNQVIFAQSWLCEFKDSGVHNLNNPRSAAHIFDFLWRLYTALPVHQTCCVVQDRVR